MEIEGGAVIAQRLIEIDQKLRKLETRKNKNIDPKTDLYLLQENLLKIIQINRERLIELNVKLPNGELLGAVLKKIYPETEFHSDFYTISSEILHFSSRTNESNRSFYQKKTIEII